ncbi:hypothetical protein EOC93_25830 [Mesorhizobium sp. M6A.T.Ce.TU.002.03.1.1]|uniref:abortive infection family protein n=1 Tax=Mesorhizobium sp. M6A.T.Ce.TU.002.03.1.1 TaxID=2496782 RepID=UPI000FCA56A0|nr:abortive infection family protein [Mesorhizobium sp. M6A.T.Ce.TU.002.03.1.1]RUU35731.1 hypothetical protein EOC93_25830 [Mesorhizobium sp. M6A.T.Ce.TU.002.03.1.1]
MEKSVTATLRTAIVDALYPISANMLADVGEAVGLTPGTRDEAFSSKQRYVSKRLLKLSPENVLDIARKVHAEYPTEDLERALQRAVQSHPADSTISNSLASFDESGVHTIWQRALGRRESDPEGALTLARTLLEEVCKHIIEASGKTYGDKDELPRLYRTAAECLNLAPDQHTEDIFKRILGGCQTVVEGLGSIRNRLSDAHGKGRKPARPSARHAALAVNLAGAMATFLVQTWNERSA